MLEQCASHETLVWLPDAIIDGDLLMFLRAARSMAAFVGWCDGGSTDDGCAAASMDEITINALHLLHQHEYDTGRALQALVKVINPKSVDKRWSDDDAKKFVRGLKQHGKNFFKIRRDLLANKETSQLVEYYYLWKKTPAASTTRPHRRHRRPVLRRQAPTPTLPSNEELEDLSSASEGSEHESDEDDGDALSANTCFDCGATNSSSWYEQESHVVCANCVRKYNGSAVDASSGDAAEDASEPPPFMFRPVKEEIDWKHDVAVVSKNAIVNYSEDAVKHVANGVKREPGGHSGTASGERTSPSGDSSCSGSMASHPETTKDENMVNGQPTRSPSDIYRETGNSDETEQNQVEMMHRSGSEHNDQSDEFSNQEISSKLVPPQDSFAVDSANLSFHQNDWKHKETLDKKPPTEYQADGCRDDSIRAMGREDSAAAPWYRFNPVESFEMFNSAYGAKSESQAVDFRGYPPPASLGAVPQIKSEPPMLESGSDERGTKSSKWSEQSVPHSFMPPWNAIEVEQSVDKSASRADFDKNSHRVVASVVPTQMSGGGLTEEGIGMPSIDSRHSLLPHYPPPLVPLRASPEPHHSMIDSSSGAPSADHHRFDSENRHFTVSGSRSGGPSSMFDRHVGISPPPALMDRSRSPSGCRVEESESDSEREHARRSPSPEPQMTNVEFYRSKSAVFMKRWHRGYNSCSRCDLEFVPLPNSALVRRREERAAARAAHVSSHKSAAAPVSVVKDGRKMDNKPNRDYDDKKKVNTPPANQSSDAQITSSLMGPGHHLPIFGPTERLTPREPFPIGHDPTPALRQLSEYARPHIGVSAAAAVAAASSSRDMQRCMPYGLPGLPPGHPGMDPFLRMPGVYPPGSREALELEMERDKREREAWERQMRDIRELEFMEKMKQEMDLKLPGFDRLAAAAAAGQLDPLWLAELQRRYVTSGGPPPPPGHMPGVFQPPPANVAADLMQRERERIDREMAARSSQEQQQMAAAAAAAARDNGAIYQLYQRYAHDPAALQRHLSTYLAMSASKAHDNEVARMMDASHLVYHFARADPLSAAGSSNAQGGPPPQMGPPQSLPSHGMPPGGMANHPLIAAAREQERAYLDLLSRPPYSTDPIMAQQLSLQVAAQQEAIQRQLAMERECLGGGPPGSMMMH